MSCERIRGKLADHLTDRLDDDGAPLVAEHLDQCAECRRFLAGLHELYALDLEAVPDFTPSTQLRGPFTTRSTPSWRRVALVAACLAGAYLAWVLFRGKAEETPSVPITGIEIHIPGAWFEGEWLDDFARARELSDYSGRPLLVAWYYPPCPRCVAIEPDLTSVSTQAQLADFVTVRAALPDEGPYPAWIEQLDLPWSPIYMSPIMRIEDGEQRSEPIIEVGTMDDVFGLASRWRARSSMATRRTLTPDQYEACRRDLSDLRDRLARGDRKGCLAIIDRLIGRGARCRTRFADDARAWRAALDVAAAGRR
ncbi:MAG: hypothetical protein KDB53_16150 [Planctomycetes bacterium]|nr:hypothetical protein [Planctomycetota bacterium]